MSEEDFELESLGGVGPVTKQKLVSAGIYNILDLASRGPSEIADIMNINRDKATELCDKARDKLIELGRLEKEFISASELYKKRQAIDRIHMGSNNLDDLLAGGIETQAITEFYGEYGSGKTQICHTLCVIVQMPKEQGGLSAGAIYLDTENTFRPERIVEIAEAYDLDHEEVLSKIIVAKAYNSAHQEFIINEVGRIIEKEDIRLLIVDSAVAHYRAEFLGRGTLAERQQRLNRFMHHLLRIAEIYNVAVVATNQVQSAPDVFFGDPSRPTGGHVIAHTSTYRIYLRKAGKNRIARMVDSPSHPEREVVFVLNEKGVDDPPDSTPKRGR
ncbi:MAG: DNA repair and recombination protein RadA [Candidatus Methylarchaceae archaeon HK02M1]|nr:DNA repair and recombination protein RadA [Candidatus Methylarchaceae archaeon HK02M1]